MKKLLLIGLLMLVALLGAETVRVYYSLDVSSNPDSSMISIKPVLSADWIPYTISPTRLDLYKDLDLSEFMDQYLEWGKPISFVSDRYERSRHFPSERALFDQLKADFGDAIIRDVGVMPLGWIKAEKDSCTTVTKSLSLNTNVSFASFDPVTASSKPNRINLTLLYICDNGRMAEAVTALLDISSEPSNAVVYCDNEYVGHTPLKVWVTWHTPTSKLEVRCEKTGYPTKIRKVGSGDNPLFIDLIAPDKPEITEEPVTPEVPAPEDTVPPPYPDSFPRPAGATE